MKNGVSLRPQVSGVCFEWPLRPVDFNEAEEAMRKSLPEAAHLEVLELSRAPVPDGVLEFPIDGLQGSMWRGGVRYAGIRRYEVWARVRVTSRQTRVVLLEPLRSGEILSAS